MTHQVQKQEVTPQDIAQEQRNREQWQAAQVALLLPEVSSTLLKQVEEELRLVGSLNTSFQEANVASGTSEVDAAKINASCAIASAPASLGATFAMSQIAARPSAELKDLDAQQGALRDELSGQGSGVRIGHDDAELPTRSRDEILAELDHVKDKRGFAQDKMRMYAQLPDSAGKAAGQIISASGSVASANSQKDAKIEQADGSIYSQEANAMKELYTQAVQMIQAFRNVNPYESQAAVVRG